MAEEIGDIRNRLKALENNVAELRAGAVFMAKIMGRELCWASYETFLTYQKGEQRQAYEKFWNRKLESLAKETEDLNTVYDVFEKVLEFREELVKFFEAPQVDTADKAMEIAHSFIKKYSPVALPLKAIKEDNIWTVDIDVGPLAVKVAKVRVDARTGDILSYDIPQKESKENK